MKVDLSTTFNVFPSVVLYHFLFPACRAGDTEFQLLIWAAPSLGGPARLSSEILLPGSRETEYKNGCFQGQVLCSGERLLLHFAEQVTSMQLYDLKFYLNNVHRLSQNYGLWINMQLFKSQDKESVLAFLRRYLELEG